MSHAELLAALYAEPERDDLRSVYADALIDAGDPRGEFIALQLARHAGRGPSPREISLLRTYARAWLGTLEPSIHDMHLIYRRGFPAVARTRGPAPSAIDPAWATFEGLYISHPTFSIALAEPPFSRLHRVAGLESTMLQDILQRASEPLPWRVLGLRTLPLHQPTALDLLRPLQLEELDLRQDRFLTPEIVNAVSAALPSLRRLYIHSDQIDIFAVPEVVVVPTRDFKPVPTGTCVHLERDTRRLVAVCHTGPEELRLVCRCLERLPVGSVSAVVLESLPRRASSGFFRERVVELCRRHDVPPPTFPA